MEKREDRNGQRKSKNRDCEIDSSYCSEIEGLCFFFFLSPQKLCIYGEIWNSLSGGPSCKQQYWFPQTWSNFGTTSFVFFSPAALFKGLERLWWGNVIEKHLTLPHLLIPEWPSCFCNQSHDEKRVKEISTVSRVSLRTQLQDGRFPLLAVPVKRFTSITTWRENNPFSSCVCARVCACALVCLSIGKWLWEKACGRVDWQTLCTI